MPYEEETAGVAGERLAMARDGDWSGSWNWKSVVFPQVPARAGMFAAVDWAPKVVQLDGSCWSWSHHFDAGPIPSSLTAWGCNARQTNQASAEARWYMRPTSTPFIPTTNPVVPVSSQFSLPPWIHGDCSSQIQRMDPWTIKGSKRRGSGRAATRSEWFQILPLTKKSSLWRWFDGARDNRSP